MFESPLNESILKRARDEGLLEITLHDLRDYTLDKHRRVDDCPFGGGVGMIMNVDPIVRAIEAVKGEEIGGAHHFTFARWQIVQSEDGPGTCEGRKPDLRVRPIRGCRRAGSEFCR